MQEYYNIYLYWLSNMTHLKTSFILCSLNEPSKSHLFDILLIDGIMAKLPINIIMINPTMKVMQYGIACKGNLFQQCNVYIRLLTHLV